MHIYFHSLFTCFIVRRKAAEHRTVGKSQTTMKSQGSTAQNRNDSIDSPNPKEDELQSNPWKKRKLNEASARKNGSKQPPDETRFDEYNHLPLIDEKKSATRCKNPECKNQSTHVYCEKCNVHLCLTIKRNCFYKFHKKNK